MTLDNLELGDPPQPLGHPSSPDSTYAESELLDRHLDRLRQILQAHATDPARSAESGAALPELPALARLGALFNLSAFEQTLLLLCVGVELEPNFQSLCAQAQGHSHQSYPTLGLALAALPGADWSILSPQTPLRHWRLIQVEPGRILTQCPIYVDRRILCYLLGEAAIDEHLAGLVIPLSQPTLPEVLPPSHWACVAQLVAAWATPDPAQGYPVLHLSGADAASKAHLAVAACQHLGFSIMSLAATVLPTTARDLKQFQLHWEREAILTNSVLLLDCDGASPPDPGRDAAIALFIDTLNPPLILSSNNRKPVLRRSLITIELPPLTFSEQIALWRTHLGESADNLNGEINALAAQFHLSPTAIATACNQFKTQNPSPKAQRPTKSPLEAPATSPQNPKSKIQNPLWTLCRLQARPNLDDLAQRIETVATWEDLVLPDQQRLVLSDIATHLQYRARVYQDWGFANKGDRGLGVSALFYGESGTGKTMAAAVLANSCQLDLYRIDLSTVVSKYIGETEKNLRRIFEAAETGGVILLFDEADALFGQRSEVKDSHDRHANIEVSYLLQRMETYQGLAILTSNMKNALDQAFLRRIRFMALFPFPDAAARSEIWRRIFPQHTPTQNLDYAKLGQLKATGGNIRNIALNAAFLAAQTDQPVSMDHLRQAAQREYLKLERLLTQAEIRGWEGEG